MRRRPAPSFAGQVAVVTGAGSGIGRATAVRLAGLGAAVHLSDLDEVAARRTADLVAAAGGRAHAHRLDVTDAGAVLAHAEEVFAREGAVDVLHNNAGIGGGGPVEATPLSDWRRIVEVNLMGVVHGVHAFVPKLLEQGRPAHVINTASMLGILPGVDIAPYTASKHAVVGLTQSLNAELSPRGITFTALCPGIVHTAITSTSQLRGPLEAKQDRVDAFYARFGSTPEVVADAVVDSIVSRKLIRTVPRAHVVPQWALWRLSPRLAQPVARWSTKLIGR